MENDIVKSPKHPNATIKFVCGQNIMSSLISSAYHCLKNYYCAMGFHFSTHVTGTSYQACKKEVAVWHENARPKF